MKSRHERFQFMEMGLDIDSWRGWESTGMALVTEKAKEAPIIYKRAVNGRDFIQLNQVKKYLNDIEKYPVVLGHNRAATTGRGNITDHNAHPFHYGRITLVHNGHIRNTHEFQGAALGADCLVDSAQVAWAMDHYGEKEVLEKAEGGFVFVWWNRDTGILNIARNAERPLHFAFAAKENSLYWASEFTELLHLMKDIEIDEDIGVLYPEARSWYQFNLKDLREFTKTPFVKGQGRPMSRTSQSQNGPSGESAARIAAGWTQEEWDAWETYGISGLEDDQQMRNPHRTAISDTEEVEEIRQSVANSRLKDIKIAGVPTSQKRLKKAKMDLKAMGLVYQQIKVCEPISWAPYKNQLDFGSVIAKTKQEGYFVEVLHVKKAQWDEYSKNRQLLVEVINVRNGPTNDKRVVATVSPRMADFLERQKSNGKSSAGGEAETDKATGGGSIDRVMDGPDGLKVSIARWMELTVGGCASCQCDIDPKHHGAITWVGSPSSPICAECSSDPGRLELLGLAPQYRKPLVAVH